MSKKHAKDCNSNHTHKLAARNIKNDLINIAQQPKITTAITDTKYTQQVPDSS